MNFDFRHSTRIGRMLAVPLALAGMAAPASATHSIFYTGTALFWSYSSAINNPPGLVNGLRSFRAIFRYDDANAMVSAGFAVGGVTRENFVCPTFYPCQPLAIHPTSLGSTVATTPEDGAQIGVSSPGQFGGIDFLSPRRQHYDLVAGDESSVFLTFALFDLPKFGYAYSYSIDGSVTSIDSAVPEPAGWALLIAGFGLTGVAARRIRAVAVAA